MAAKKTLMMNRPKKILITSSRITTIRMLKICLTPKKSRTGGELSARGTNMTTREPAPTARTRMTMGLMEER